MKIILASESMQRKKALEILGLKYTTKPSNIDEKKIRYKNPKLMAKKISEAKALEVGKKEKDAIIVTGDLFVIFKGKIYEKPISEEEAFEVIKSFSGKWFKIVSAVAVYNTETNKMFSGSDSYKLKFRKLTFFGVA